MSKQTAVELLEQQLKERYSLMNSEPLFDQAKQMYSKDELADLIDATFQGRQDVADLFSELLKNLKTK
jgi:hypothetical protein